MCQSVSLTEENRENPKKSPCFVAEYIVTLATAREHQNFPSCLVVVAFPVNQVKPTDSGGCQPLLAPPRAAATAMAPHYIREAPPPHCRRYRHSHRSAAAVSCGGTTHSGPFVFTQTGQKRTPSCHVNLSKVE